MMSCDGPRGNTTIVPFSGTGGVIESDRYGLEPYTVIPSTPPRRDSFSSQPIEPLDRIDRLDDLDSFTGRHDDRDRLNDPLLPLLLGE